MEKRYHLKCMICGSVYSPNEVEYVCPKHNNTASLEVVYDYDYLAKQLKKDHFKVYKDRTIWRFGSLLPLSTPYPAFTVRIGDTPLYKQIRLGTHLGLDHLFIKDDGQLPTGSLKDRASAIAIAKTKEKGYKIVATASTGNAAAALSGLSASVGQANVIFVPASAPKAKIAQLLVYGSKVILVEGTYDDAFELCLKACEHFNWYNRNTGFNPYMTEGKKTVALEIWEQMGGKVPDVVFVSVGDGCIIGGVHKGFKDLMAMGWIDKMPRLIGVQSTGSNYLTEAWENDENLLTKAPIHAHTLADSISAGLPRDRLKAMAAVKETNGAYISVSDEAILAATSELPRWTGIFAEPAGATALAGLIKALENQLVKKDERIVLINTGNGLKDIAGAMNAVEMAGRQALRVTPSLDELLKVFDR